MIGAMRSARIAVSKPFSSAVPATRRRSPRREHTIRRDSSVRLTLGASAGSSTGAVIE